MGLIDKIVSTVGDNISEARKTVAAWASIRCDSVLPVCICTMPTAWMFVALAEVARMLDHVALVGRSEAVR